MEPPHNEVSAWVEVGIWISVTFASFVGGIVTATWAVAAKVGKYDKRIVVLEVSDKDKNKDCETKQERLKAEITVIVKDTMEKFYTTWGPEMAGAQQQRSDQADTLKEIKEAIVKVHGRIDDVLKSDRRQYPR